jgi:hypothetical protein
MRLLGDATAAQGGVMTPEQISPENERRSAAWQDIWREGYLAALGQLEAREAAGYARAIADVKAAQHGLYNHLRGLAVIEARRWTVRGEPRTRATFGQPHKDDYPGRAAA